MCFPIYRPYFKVPCNLKDTLFFIWPNIMIIKKTILLSLLLFLLLLFLKNTIIISSNSSSSSGVNMCCQIH